MKHESDTTIAKRFQTVAKIEVVEKYAAQTVLEVCFSLKFRVFFYLLALWLKSKCSNVYYCGGKVSNLLMHSSFSSF